MAHLCDRSRPLRQIARSGRARRLATSFKPRAREHPATTDCGSLVNKHFSKWTAVPDLLHILEVNRRRFTEQQYCAAPEQFEPCWESRAVGFRHAAPLCLQRFLLVSVQAESAGLRLAGRCHQHGTEQYFNNASHLVDIRRLLMWFCRAGVV